MKAGQSDTQISSAAAAWVEANRAERKLKVDSQLIIAADRLGLNRL